MSSSDHSMKQNGNFKCFTIFWNLVFNVCYLASHAWCLGRLLPLIPLADCVAILEDDERWMNFMLLLSISDRLLAPTQTEEGAAYLRILIRDHHQQFVHLYPTCRIIPKMHYLIHYPDWIVR